MARHQTAIILPPGLGPCDRSGPLPEATDNLRREDRPTRLAVPPAAERVELTPVALQRLERRESGPKAREDLGERPDLVVVAVEADIQGRPGVGVLERAGAGLLLIEGVDVAVEVD